MRILLCRWNSICEPDIQEALIDLGHCVEELTHPIESVDYDKKYLELLSQKLMKTSYDLIFSVNYIPIISRVCKVFGKVYLSWTMDSPLLQLYSDTIHNECNRIFIFDKLLYQEFYQENPEHIFYMPLAANIKHSDMISQQQDAFHTNAVISFVESLETEGCRYNSIPNMPEYLRGYTEGLIEAQLKVYGYNFIQDVLPDEIVQAFKSCGGWYQLGADYKVNDKAIVAQEYIGKKCSEIERSRLFRALSGKYPVQVYTSRDTGELPEIINKGPASSREDLPGIYKSSSINLNITEKTIRSGLPQRVFDVLAAGGFLITNYQAELPDFFEIGKDLVVYESEADLIQKCEYYLQHEKERNEIARCGSEKVKQCHTFQIRLKEMLQMI